MKIGFRTATFYKWGLDRTLQTLAQAGYDGVDIALEHPDTNPILLKDPQKVDQVRRMIADAGLELVAVSWHIGCNPESISHTMDIAQQMGANLVITNGDPIPLAGAKAEWPRTVERIRKLAELAEKKGLILALEPDFVPGFTIASSAEFERLADEVDSPCLKLNLDINHAAISDDDFLASIRRLRQYLVGLHLSDSRNRVHEHLIPGQGELDWLQIRSTLDEIGFDGYCVIDIFDDFDTPGRTATESLQALKRMWNMK